VCGRAVLRARPDSHYSPLRRFAIPRIIEGIALLVVLPAMFVGGVIRGFIKQFK